MIAILLFSCVICVLLYELFYPTKTKIYGEKLPGPRRLPFIGNAHLMAGTGADFLKFSYESFEKYGNRYRTFVGSRLFVNLRDPKDVEVILTSNHLIEKALEYNLLHPWIGKGLLTSKGDLWRRHRKFITPSFHFNILKQFVPVFESKTNILVEKLKNKLNEKPIDVYPLITLNSLDIIAQSSMGVSIDAQTNEHSPYVQAVAKLSKVVQERMRSAFIRYDTIFNLLPSSNEYYDALKTVHQVTNKVICDRKKILEEKGAENFMKQFDETGSKKTIAFLDLLLTAGLQGEPLTDSELREEVDTFLFEGHDTTASGVSFACYALSENIDEQEKLYAEQKAIFADDLNRPITHADIQEMKYLDMAIRESLRLFPPAPQIGRNCHVDTVINDMYLPENTNVVIDIYAMNRNPEVFEHPHKFDPNRFQSEEMLKKNPYSNVSFSAGPRNCIGQKFAMLEMKVVLSKLIRNFIFKPSNIPPMISTILVLKSENGINLIVEPRNS